MRTVRGGRVDVKKGRGRGQPAPVDSLLWPAHVSIAGLVLLTMSFAVIPGCFSRFLLCSGSFILFVRRVLFHGWRSRVRPHVSAASCAAAGAPARAPVARARTLAAGASPPLFGVVFLGLLLLVRARASAAYGRLRVLVLGHRLGVLLCLCLGWFFGAVAAVLVLVHPLLMGGCTCSCTGTGWGCFSAFVWGGFWGLLLPCSCSCIRCLWAVARARARAPAGGASLPLFGVIFWGCCCCARARASAAYGRLHVLVLGHRLGVLLCLSLG